MQKYVKEIMRTSIKTILGKHINEKIKEIKVKRELQGTAIDPLCLFVGEITDTL